MEQEQKQEQKFPLVSPPRLEQWEFDKGDEYLNFAIHPMAGYPLFIIEAYNCTFVMHFIGYEDLGTLVVFEYEDEDSEMCAFIAMRGE